VNIAAFLFEIARRQPHLPAVSDGVHVWSYGEFVRRISCLAGGLRAQGLEPGDRVILCMENCAEFLESRCLRRQRC
jgi:long-chain acyl-CoA synthetase